MLQHVKHLLAMMLVASVGCTTRMRNEEGTVLNPRYAMTQARDMATNAPLLFPFIPIGLGGNAIRASRENGRFALAGTVVDEAGTPLEKVTLQITTAKMVLFDLDEDFPIFYEETHDSRINGRFEVNRFAAHTVKLRFTREGYQPREYHFELSGDFGLPWDNATPGATPVYSASPFIADDLRIVMSD
jgi:hypothetical protein